MEIGRRPDKRTEVSELAHIGIVKNLVTEKRTPREALFGAIYRNITPWEKQNHSLPKAGTGLPTAEGSVVRGQKYLDNFLRNMRAAPELSTHRPVPKISPRVISSES